MARNRYAADYRLIEEFDTKGHVKVSYEYIGEDYLFTVNPQMLRKHKKRCGFICISEWVLFLAALIPYSTCMQRLWIALPFVFAAVPLALLTELIRMVQRQENPLEHRVADKLENAYPAQLFALLLLSGTAAVTSVVHTLLFAGRAPGNYVFILCAWLMVAGAWYQMKTRNVFSVQKSTEKIQQY